MKQKELDTITAYVRQAQEIKNKIESFSRLITSIRRHVKAGKKEFCVRIHPAVDRYGYAHELTLSAAEMKKTLLPPLVAEVKRLREEFKALSALPSGKES